MIQDGLTTTIQFRKRFARRREMRKLLIYPSHLFFLIRGGKEREFFALLMLPHILIFLLYCVRWLTHAFVRKTYPKYTTTNDELASYTFGVYLYGWAGLGGDVKVTTIYTSFTENDAF